MVYRGEKRNGKYFHQGIKVSRFEVSKDEVRDIFARTIASIINCMEKIFHELAASPLFKNLASLLNISTINISPY